jgi:hypothetical protein
MSFLGIPMFLFHELTIIAGSSGSADPCGEPFGYPLVLLAAVGASIEISAIVTIVRSNALEGCDQAESSNQS